MNPSEANLRRNIHVHVQASKGSFTRPTSTPSSDRDEDSSRTTRACKHIKTKYCSSTVQELLTTATTTVPHTMNNDTKNDQPSEEPKSPQSSSSQVDPISATITTTHTLTTDNDKQASEPPQPFYRRMTLADIKRPAPLLWNDPRLGGRMRHYVLSYSFPTKDQDAWALRHNFRPDLDNFNRRFEVIKEIQLHLFSRCRYAAVPFEEDRSVDCSGFTITSNLSPEELAWGADLKHIRRVQKILRTGRAPRWHQFRES
ncbi:hypothetical protein D9615_009429 [Tricholomella constricta]|uniref:Uncharacterized protein n=1 Tax=Tricholomella constricta TaxID=117010 RepID=A0A8H5GYS1_9AGAR|nr:hypothetical protein D9615_009429 [Tricholomella constricta]